MCLIASRYYHRSPKFQSEDNLMYLTGTVRLSFYSFSSSLVLIRGHNKNRCLNNITSRLCKEQSPLPHHQGQTSVARLKGEWRTSTVWKHPTGHSFDWGEIKSSRSKHSRREVKEGIHVWPHRSERLYYLRDWLSQTLVRTLMFPGGRI